MKLLSDLCQLFKSSKSWLFFLSFGFLVIPCSVSAQSINPYVRLVDPSAISFVDSASLSPLQGKCFVGKPKLVDATDGYSILAADTGSGILSHFWFTVDRNAADASMDLKIWADDSLLLESHPRALHSNATGLLASPLDTTISGGFVCDVQIPFRRSFRITFNGQYTFCAIFWCPVRDSNRIEPIASNEVQLEQRAGEKAYWSKDSPWKSAGSVIGHQNTIVESKSVTTFAEIYGPAMIETVRLVPNDLSNPAWDSVYLCAYWDLSPVPSVSVPLKEFFGCGVHQRIVNSFQLRSDLIGFISYLPMPFAVHGRLALENRTQTQLSMTDSVEFLLRPVDRGHDGYLTTVRSDENPTKPDMWHPVAHLLGRGRYFGLQLYVPHAHEDSFLEGNPRFQIDSSSATSFEYTGTEDFFDGGWYFQDSIFSLPFVGFTDFASSFYRFHYLDPIDFTSSFDFDIQHGQINDFITEYRTVAYFYMHRDAYWLSTDTVRVGDDLQVFGNGYTPNAQLIARIDGSIVKSVRSTDSGTCAFAISSFGLLPGRHQISVNGELSPYPLIILSRPSLTLQIDTVPFVKRWGDRVQLSGHGFTPGEAVSFYLDTAEAFTAAKVLADSAGSLFANISIPWVDAHPYILKGVGSGGTVAWSDSSINVSRDLNYEFEDLLPATTNHSGASWSYMGWHLPERWSNQAIVFCYADKGAAISFGFYLPVSDTFKTIVYVTKGLRFADYRISIDSSFGADFSGFSNGDFNIPLRSGGIDAGTHFLTKGFHVIRFDNIGRNDSCVEYSLGPDNFVLVAASQFHLLQSVPLNPVSLDNIEAYPDPIISRTLRVKVESHLVIQSSSPVEIHLFDAIGKDYGSVFQGLLTGQSTVLSIPIPLVSAGAYFLRVSSPVLDHPVTITVRILGD